MGTSQARFKQTDDKLINLIKCLQEFKSSTEFRYCSSNADKVKLYESVRKALADEDEPEAFGLSLVSENPYKDLHDFNETDLTEYQVKVKKEKEQIKRGYSRVQETVNNLRQKFSIYSKLILSFNPG